MKWEPDATALARGILRKNAQDLYDEAERVAQRADAPGVSKDYVRQAATTLRLRRASALADVMLAIGPALASLAGGVGVAELTSETALDLDTWAVVGSYAAGVIGLLMSGAGIAMKLRRA